MIPLFNEIFYFENYKLIAIDGRCEDCYFHNRESCSNISCTGDKRNVIFKIYENK